MELFGTDGIRILPIYHPLLDDNIYGMWMDKQ